MSRRDPTVGTYPDFSEIQSHVSTLASCVSSWLPSISRAPGERSGRSGIENRSSFSVDERSVAKEERVHHLLEVNGGRMYQADVVESTAMSKSTVSRVLGEMEQEEEIVRHAVGRQKVVCNPQGVPERIESDSSK